MVAIGDDDEEDEEDEEESDEDEARASGPVVIPAGGIREPVAEGEDAESETNEDEEGTDEEEEYGVPMELGSVREERDVRTQLGVSESFGKMSISPVQGVLSRRLGGSS